MSMLPIFLIILGFAVAGSVFLLAFAVRRYARATGAMDQPTGGRKIHQKPTPLLGGLAIALVLFVFLLWGAHGSWFETIRGIRGIQIFGFLIALSLILVVGCRDDYRNTPAWKRFFWYAVACAIIIVTGTRISQITQWGGMGGYSLEWWRWSSFVFPADLLTFIWLLSVTFAMKLLDGLDGLVAGQTVIGAALVAGLALTQAYSQPSIAILGVIIGAAYAGFLPHNFYPAKQFLGEAGSAMAGFTLAFIAILAGAKMATALMAVGLPLTDASLVVAGRLFRGISPFRGDDTHLHFKLLKAGLSQRQVVGILWAIALLFGLLAFAVQTRGKILLLFVLAGVTILLPFFVRLMRRSRVPNI